MTSRSGIAQPEVLLSAMRSVERTDDVTAPWAHCAFYLCALPPWSALLAWEPLPLQ